MLKLPLVLVEWRGRNVRGLFGLNWLNETTEKNMAPKDETGGERKARYERIGKTSAKIIKNILAGTVLGHKLRTIGTGGERTIGRNECAHCNRQLSYCQMLVTEGVSRHLLELAILRPRLRR
jgi:hypothetical protein